MDEVVMLLQFAENYCELMDQLRAQDHADYSLMVANFIKKIKARNNFL